MYIGIDLGGTNIAVGCVDGSGRLLSKVSAPTMAGRDYKEIVKDMARLCDEATKKAGQSLQETEKIGIGSPGTVDSENGVVVFSGNLKFDHAPIAEELRRYIDVPIHMENDANAAAYGEYIACGNGADSFLLITLGTGVGGGIIIDKKIYRGFNSAGAEIGHTSLYMDGIPCTCGRRGCYERYASVTALKQQTEEKMKLCPTSLMNEWVKKNGSVSGRTAFDCAARGDSAAKEVRKRYIEYVAEGIVNVLNIFQPEIIAIGGGISREGDVLLKPLTEYVYKYDFNKYMPKTEIKIAELFNEAGIVGAAMAAKHLS